MGFQIECLCFSLWQARLSVCDGECVMNVGISFYQKFSTYKLKRFHFPHYFRFFSENFSFHSTTVKEFFIIQFDFDFYLDSTPISFFYPPPISPLYLYIPSDWFIHSLCAFIHIIIFSMKLSLKMNSNFPSFVHWLIFISFNFHFASPSFISL